ncbi:MAG: hypothetical protein AAGA75_18675 [Cyanobacteria bacterium P01_E01_bin.6]
MADNKFENNFFDGVTIGNFSNEPDTIQQTVQVVTEDGNASISRTRKVRPSDDGSDFEKNFEGWG